MNASQQLNTAAPPGRHDAPARKQWQRPVLRQLIVSRDTAANGGSGVDAGGETFPP